MSTIILWVLGISLIIFNISIYNKYNEMHMLIQKADDQLANLESVHKYTMNSLLQTQIKLTY
jgi:hypothetical protein